MFPGKRILLYTCFTTAWAVLFLCSIGIARQHMHKGYQCLFTGPSPKSSAKAIFRLEEGGQRLHYTLTVENIDNITMAHLHLGTVGTFGAPVVWLYPSSPPPEPIKGRFSGVLAEGTIEADDLIGPLRNAPLSELIKHMQRGYTFANIHTEEHPTGEICGPVRLIGPEKTPPLNDQEQ